MTESASISQTPDVAVASPTAPEVIETSQPEPKETVSVSTDVIDVDSPEPEAEAEIVDESSSADSHRINLVAKQTQIEDTISHLETQLIEWLELVFPEEGDAFKQEIGNRLHALANDFMNDVPS